MQEGSLLISLLDPKGQSNKVERNLDRFKRFPYRKNEKHLQ